MADQTIEVSVPNSAQDFLNIAWEKHVAREYGQAAEDFRQAIQLDDSLIDAYYGLGLTLKALRQDEEAIACLNKVIEMVLTLEGEDRARSEMLRRLSIGHINRIKTGDWGLEGEIWQHTK